MNDLITMTLFVVIWVTFCQLTIALYDRICYHILDHLIEKGNEQEQIKISKFLGNLNDN